MVVSPGAAESQPKAPEEAFPPCELSLQIMIFHDNLPMLHQQAHSEAANEGPRSQDDLDDGCDVAPFAAAVHRCYDNVVGAVTSAW